MNTEWSSAAITKLTLIPSFVLAFFPGARARKPVPRRGGGNSENTIDFRDPLPLHLRNAAIRNDREPNRCKEERERERERGRGTKLIFNFCERRGKLVDQARRRSKRLHLLGMASARHGRPLGKWILSGRSRKTEERSGGGIGGERWKSWMPAFLPSFSFRRRRRSLCCCPTKHRMLTLAFSSSPAQRPPTTAPSASGGQQPS